MRGAFSPNFFSNYLNHYCGGRGQGTWPPWRPLAYIRGEIKLITNYFLFIDDSICQDEYVGVEVDKFGSSLRKLNGRYEEAVLLYNRPVYIQFEKPFDAESQIRKDNCIWWHSTDRRWQIGNCNDIGARGQAYFDKDVKCLPNFQIRDSWRGKSGDALLKGRTESKYGCMYFSLDIVLFCQITTF